MKIDKVGIAPTVATTGNRKAWHAPVLSSFDASDAEAGATDVEDGSPGLSPLVAS